MATILIADDEPNVTRLVGQALREAGYDVVEANDGEAALDLFFERNPDLLILDIRMPRMDGNKVLSWIREASSAPIIILSGRDAETDKVLSLDIGADDYVTKPVGKRELLARVQTVLRRARRRAGSEAQRVFDDGFVRVDFAKHEALARGQPMGLTPIEFRILATLVRSAGRTVPHKDLIAEVWGDAAEPDAVKWHMSRLRRKLGDDSDAEPIVRTVRGVGYRYDLRPTTGVSGPATAG